MFLNCWVALAAASDDIPRLRTILPNGLTVLAERMPAPYVSAQVWMASAPGQETALTHGYRHLLEHIMARVDGGRWDSQIESFGGVLEAETSREGTSFRIRLPKNQLPLALDCLSAILKERSITQDNVKREARAIYHESALRSSFTKRVSLAWTKYYGEQGLDPFGDPDLLANASPKSLQTQWSQMLTPSRMAITVVGDVDIDAVSNQLKRKFSGISVREAEPVLPIKPLTETGVPTGMWVAKVGSPSDTKTAAALAAGLAIGSQLPDSFFSYSPLINQSLVIVGTNEEGSDRLEMDPDDLFDLGKRLAHQWVERQLRDPYLAAALRGKLLAQSSGLRPETILANIDGLSRADFVTAFSEFKESKR